MEQEHGYTYRKDDVLKRLRRIEGQTRGLQRMVDEDTYCIDVLTQVAAVTKALQAVSLSPARGPHQPLRRERRQGRRGRGPREGHRGRRRHRKAGALMSNTAPQTYDVTGMTCGHCELSVPGGGRRARGRPRGQGRPRHRPGHRDQRRAPRPDGASPPPSRRPATSWHEHVDPAARHSSVAASRSSRSRSGWVGWSARWPPSRWLTTTARKRRRWTWSARTATWSAWPRAQGGYTLTLGSIRAAGRARSAMSFTRPRSPTAPPVTAYDEQHERDLHLIVVRRDLTGFQHVHPTLDDRERPVERRRPT